MYLVDRIELFVLRTVRAWRYYRLLHYSWRLAWAKAGYRCGLTQQRREIA